MEKACKVCKKLTEEKECPLCKSEKLTTNWKGVVIVFNTESEIAKSINCTTPGKYALHVL